MNIVIEFLIILMAIKYLALQDWLIGILFLWLFAKTIGYLFLMFIKKGIDISINQMIVKQKKKREDKVNYHALNPNGFEGVASNDDRKATIHYDKLRK